MKKVLKNEQQKNQKMSDMLVDLRKNISIVADHVKEKETEITEEKEKLSLLNTNAELTKTKMEALKTETTES